MTVPSVFLKLTTRNKTMDMTMSSIRPNRVEVVTSVQRRRRWTPEQKLEIVKQTNEPGSSVCRQCIVWTLCSRWSTYQIRWLGPSIMQNGHGKTGFRSVYWQWCRVSWKPYKCRGLARSKNGITWDAAASWRSDYVWRTWTYGLSEPWRLV